MVLDAQHNRKLLEDSEQGESTLTFMFLKTYSLPSPPVFPLLLRSLLVPSFLPSPHLQQTSVPVGGGDGSKGSCYWKERRLCPGLGWNQGNHADGHVGMERTGRAEKMGCWVGVRSISQ